MATPRWSILFRRIRASADLSLAPARYSAGRHEAADRSVAGRVLDLGRAAAASAASRPPPLWGRVGVGACLVAHLPPPLRGRGGVGSCRAAHLRPPLRGRVGVGGSRVGFGVDGCHAEVVPVPGSVVAARRVPIHRRRRLRAAGAATPLLVGSAWSPGLSAGRFARPFRAGCNRHDSRQPARAASSAGLFARTRIHLLDSLIEFRQPLLHGPLDLGSRSAWFLRPDARPLGANGFWRGVGVGRLGPDRDLRREFRHQQKS